VNRTGQNTGFRLRSASLTFGDHLPDNRWLADSRGFVAAIRGGGERKFRYAVVPIDQSPIVVLPSPPQPALRTDDAWLQGAVPSPHNSALISLGRTHLFNLKTGATFSARDMSAAGPDHLDPWSAGPNEMVFAFPHVAHDPEGDRPVLLAPKFETPPWDDGFNMVVEVDPSGLSMRDQPALQSPAKAILRDGDRVTLMATGGREPNQLPVSDFDGIRWFRVLAQDGREGWVNSAWLAWA
jgi:hypothetical protein